MKRLALLMCGYFYIATIFCGQAQDNSYLDSPYASFVNFTVTSYFNELKENSASKLYDGAVGIKTDPPVYVSCDEDSITIKFKESYFRYSEKIRHDLNKTTCPFTEFPSGQNAFDGLVAFLKNQKQ